MSTIDRAATELPSRRDFLRGCAAAVAATTLPGAALRRRMEDDWDALAL